MSKLSVFLKLPLQILMIVVLIASYYVAYAKIQNIGFGAPIILTVLFVLYFTCLFLEKKKEDGY